MFPSPADGEDFIAFAIPMGFIGYQAFAPMGQEVWVIPRTGMR